MRILALALLGSVVVVSMGCASQRGLSRQAAMENHIATMRPDGTVLDSRTTYVVPDDYNGTYATAASYSPAPPPPPVWSTASEPVRAQPAARAPTAVTYVQPVARAAA
ncbi:MAG: hypothetical protein O2894_03500, partial [Planctomycetota bacterium]|nr:hypothetical protein [Planctomycetota bacterium]